MDELNEFWTVHFNRPASPIERRMIAAFDRSVGAEDPIFPILMMQVCNLYETLGSTEKAVLTHGPALESQMANLAGQCVRLTDRLTAVNSELVAITATSRKLLGTQEKLLSQRDFQLRVATLPDWLKVLMVALVTAFVMMLGTIVLAVFWN